MSDNKVLFLNHKIKNCGVYQYGLRISDILIKSKSNHYIYQEVETYEEYLNLTKEKYKAIIYNYCTPTMPWLNANTINKEIKSIGLLHPYSPNIFDKACNLSPIFPETCKVYSIPRPIYEDVNDILNSYMTKHKNFIEAYASDNIPIFGSFGFACGYKGFAKMIEIINNQYDQAIIKIVMPAAKFYPSDYTNIEYNRCFAIPRKEGIKLMITHEFFSNEDLLLFLRSNTLNIFLYDYVKPDENVGISSVIDVALSVNIPIAISDSYMFRHIYHDKICLYKTNIAECIDFSKDYIKKFINDYSHENFINKINKIVDE